GAPDRLLVQHVFHAEPNRSSGNRPRCEAPSALITMVYSTLTPTGVQSVDREAMSNGINSERRCGGSHALIEIVCVCTRGRLAVHSGTLWWIAVGPGTR